jgi:hypothetical protein|eukprot:COSAG01_NODE_559_length_15469_cov_11.071308_9_plen_1321_part_00
MDGALVGFKEPRDAEAGKKPSERISLEEAFVDEPGGPDAAPGQSGANAFNIVPIEMGKSSHRLTVDCDSDKLAEDTAAWVLALTKVIQAVNRGAGWAQSLGKTKLQAWAERSEDHTDFMFRITDRGGEWSFKQRFSGLARWHESFIVASQGSSAPAFPAKHAIKSARSQGDKFTEQRRQDLCRYFIHLLAQPGFLQSPEMDKLLNKKASEALADKARKTTSVAKDVEAATAEGEVFDESTLEASEEWLGLHQAVLPGRMPVLTSGRSETERLLSQGEGSPWHLDRRQLDLAAFEMIFLTLGTTRGLLSPKERDTLDVIAAQLGISKRKREEVVMQITEHSEQFGGGGGGTASAAAEGDVAGIGDACGGGTAKQGQLELLGKKKGQAYWFRLQGLSLQYMSRTGSGSAKLVGTIDLGECTSCRPDQSATGDTILIECKGGARYSLRAPSNDDCSEWIKTIHEAFAARRNASDDAADEEGNEEARLLDHRFRMLQSKTVEDFADAEAFLTWRQRQIVVFASGIMHSIGMFKACHSNFDASFDGVQKKLFNTWDKLLRHETGRDGVKWTDEDQADFDRRMKRLEGLVDEAYELGKRAATDGESYLERYPLAISTVLYEHLLLRTCFEDPEYGGELDPDCAMTFSLIQKMGARLGYVAGMHDVCFAMATMEQYKLAKAPSQLELLQETVEKCAVQPDSLNITCVQLQFVLIQQFCEQHLSDYHTLEERSHVALFAKVFMALHLTLQNTRMASGLIEADQFEDGENLLSGFIQSSMEKNYDVVKQAAAAESHEEGLSVLQKRAAASAVDPARIDAAMNGPGDQPWAPRQAKLALVELVVKSAATAAAAQRTREEMQELLAGESMQILRCFVEKLQEEMDDELTEFAAYIGIYHPRAAAVAGRKMADLLNADLQKLSFDLANAEVMPTWQQLKALELKIIEAMESCGDMGADAKVLHLDEQMSDVAQQWVKKQTDIFEERVGRALKTESWDAVSEDEYMSASAVDIVSMLMQVSRGYFMNELPVTEAVMKDLTEKFGQIIQRYCRITLQQCGEKPKLRDDPSAGAAAGESKAVAALGKLGGLASAMVGTSSSEVANVGAGAEGQAAAHHDGPGLPQLCVRFATVQWLSEQADLLLHNIIDGAEATNYTGASLEGVMGGTKERLQQHGEAIASHIGAHLICVTLRPQFFDQLYVPSPSVSPLRATFELVEEQMEEIMPRIQEEFHPILIRAMLAPCVELVERHVRGWKRAIAGGESVLGVSEGGDLDAVNEDLDQLEEFFQFGDAGLTLEEVQAETSALRKLVRVEPACVGRLCHRHRHRHPRHRRR